MTEIDYVITYVDGSDKEWQGEYEKVSGKKINVEKSERFRSWDNLRYNLRAVEKNLPFIRKVHLVVSGPSQVPSWINTENVHVVYHKDIIPEKYLPVFCSTSIEMFLGFISGMLSQNFDVGTIYIDAFVKLCKTDLNEASWLFEAMDELSRKHNVDFVLSVSADPASLPEFMKTLII